MYYCPKQGLRQYSTLFRSYCRKMSDHTLLLQCLSSVLWMDSTGKITVVWFIMFQMNELLTKFMSAFLISVREYTALYIFYYSLSVRRIGCCVILSFKWPVVPVPNTGTIHSRWWLLICVSSSKC